MTSPAFSHRPSRVLALFRAVLAALLGLWIWIDPDQPARDPQLGMVVYTAYMIFALAFVALAWRSWWFSFRLSIPAFVVDCLAFLVAMYFTQAINFDFFSPFITFFVFLMVAAALRWNQRSMPAIAMLLCIAFLITGLLIRAGGVEIDAAKFLRRFSYLSLLSLLLIWFAWNRAAFQVPRFHSRQSADGSAARVAALDYALENAGAAGGALAWSNYEEPWVQLQLAGTLGDEAGRRSPEEWQGFDGEAAAIFDLTNNRQILLTDNGAYAATRIADRHALTGGLPIQSGVCVSLNGVMGTGQLFLTGIANISWDDLATAKGLAHEIAMALDDMEREALAREVALNRIRTDIARDLHDSVAQSLAGVRYRLDGLRAQLDQGQDPAAELDDISSSIRLEQEQVRTILQRLRRGEQAPGSNDLIPHLGQLLTSIETQWRIATTLEAPGEPISLPGSLTYDIQQIVREAAANAVRHGQAKSLTVRVKEGPPGVIGIVIADDGAGFADSADCTTPRSIAERIAASGGTIEVRSSPIGVRLEMTLAIATTP